MKIKAFISLVLTVSPLAAQQAKDMYLSEPLPFADAYKWGAATGNFQATVGYAPGYLNWPDDSSSTDSTFKPVPLVAKYHRPIFLTLALRNISAQPITLSYDMSAPEGSCSIVKAANSAPVLGFGVSWMNGWKTKATIPPGGTHFNSLQLGASGGIANHILAQDPPPGRYIAHCGWTPVECIGDDEKKLGGCASTKQLPHVEAPPFEFTVVLDTPGAVMASLPRSRWADDIHTKNLEGLLSLYTPDAVVVQIDGSTLATAEEPRGFYRRLFALYDSEISFGRGGFSLVGKLNVPGAVATQSGEFTEKLRKIATDTTETVCGRYSLIWVLQSDERWLLKRAHWKRGVCSEYEL